MKKEANFISAVASVDEDNGELIPFLTLLENVITSHFAHGELILMVSMGAERVRNEIRKYFSEHPTRLLISIVTMDSTAGTEKIMNAGRDLAIGDYVYEFDDIHVDYDAGVILEAYEKCLAGNDIVTARNDKRSRFTSRLFYRIYNRMAGEERCLGPSTFRILSRRAINRVKSMGIFIPYRKAVYENAGLTSTQLVYRSTDPGSRSRHSLRQERSGIAVESFIYFTDLMERISLAICGIFFAIAVFVAIYVIVSFFSDEQLLSGWVSIMGFLSIGFTGLFGLLTIIIKYLSVLVDLTFRKQRSLIRDIEKISGV